MPHFLMNHLPPELGPPRRAMLNVVRTQMHKLKSPKHYMTSALKFLLLLACLACLSTGCSTRPAQSSHPGSLEKPAQVRRLVPPRPGVPINPAGATAYFYEEASRLIAQGKVGTNLLRGVTFKTCSLDLTVSSQRSLAPADLASAVEMSVAVVGQIVRTEKGPPQLLPVPASGFFLTESGALVTCRHVLDAPYVIGLVVMTRDGRVCPVREVLAVDATNDLAIVQVEGHGFTPIPAAPTIAPQGAPIWVFSHPQWRYYTLSAGIVSGYFAAGDDNVLQMQVTADFAGGSSGAPVFNERGEVVGIAKLTQALNSDLLASKGHVQMVSKVCTPSSALLNLLQKK